MTALARRSLRRLAGAIAAKPCHQPIHRGGKLRPRPPYCISKRTQLLLQRGIQIANALERIIKGVSPKICSHGNIPVRELAVSNLSGPEITFQNV